ncbi:MAG: DUF2807 domain-containing protein [Vicingaceae bacterium]
MRKLLTYLLIFGAFACGKDDESIRKKESLPPFHSIEINDSFEVYLVEGNEYSIEMEGAESFVDKMKFSVSDCTLVLSNEKIIKWNDPKDNTLKLWLTAKQLKFLKANETCDIKTVNPITTYEFGIVLGSKANQANIQVNNEVLYYWNDFPCGGKLTLSGKTTELKLWNTAIMTVDASALQAKRGFIENDSKGNCIASISDYLEYQIEGEGNVIVYGQPGTIKDKGSSNSGELMLR